MTRDPTGHVYRLSGAGSNAWYAKYRLPDACQVKKRIGPRRRRMGVHARAHPDRRADRRSLARPAPGGRARPPSHERFDGTRPDRPAGEDIRLGARIIVVCDAADALTSDLPHRPAQPLDAALAELVRCAGTQFDPRVVEAFCAVAADAAGAGVARPSLT